MSVICEAISVLVTREVLERTYPGGVGGYEADCPNATFCADEHLTRVGFMHPDDVAAFIASIVSAAGLTPVRDGRYVDLVVVDQMTGPTVPCNWIEHAESDGLTVAWLRSEAPGELATPRGWKPTQFTFWELDDQGRPSGPMITPEGGEFDPNADHFIGRTQPWNAAHVDPGSP